MNREWPQRAGTSSPKALDASAEAAEAGSYRNSITPRMERHNTLIFFFCYFLIYFAAPIIYIGVVQAGLFTKLGAGATLANLPASAYLLGAFAPLAVSGLVPQRLARAVAVGAYSVTTILLAIVSAVLFFPFSSSVRIAVIITQGLAQGFSGSVANVYGFQCLARGTTLVGRAKALKITLAVTPIAAVAGSLGTQLELNGKILSLRFPWDFALLYFICVPCLAGTAFLCSRYDLIDVPEEQRQPFFAYLLGSMKSFIQMRPLVWLWLTYLSWYFTYNAMTNLSLYTREAMGRDPKEFSGLIMALRFGFKALGGYALGVITIRWGLRAPLITTILLVGAAILWAWVMPGYFYLFAFGLMGAGELAGSYFPNYIVGISLPEASARNLALLQLVIPTSSVAPALYGALTDLLGFPASFTFGIGTAILSLWLVLKLPLGPSVGGRKSTG